MSTGLSPRPQNRPVARFLAFLALCFLAALPLAAQPFDFPAPTATDPAALSRFLPGLAREVLAAYRDGDRRTYLDNLFRLQLAAGFYAEADRSLAALGALGPSGAPQAGATQVLYGIFARAKARQAEAGAAFEESFPREFRDTLARQDDRTAALVLRALGADPAGLEQSVRDALPPKGQSALPLAGALALVRAWQVAETFRALGPLAASLIAEDDERRYLVEREITVRTPAGATVCALVVRPRAAMGRLTALLNFTIYANPGTMMDEARRTASHGYAGVVGLTRGKGCSPEVPVPYEHDGADAAALVDWIARQPWSDGRVGMYGGSYEGFTQWAAAKHRPRALKALMPSVTAAPGIDVPMEGNVFQTFVYYWPFYTTNNKTLDDAPYNDRQRWWRMNREWYVSGQAYRALDRIEGTPNPLFDCWLEHPAYDAYWQGMIPYRDEFAHLDIPVLTTTGYYDGGQLGALYYFREHQRHRPGAEHYLLIGPYDHVRGQRGTFSRLGLPLTVLNGYATDEVAQIDLGELRYQWFDHVFRGAPRPARLKDKVNFEVMGANRWRHAPSIAAMSPRRLRFHLSAERQEGGYRLRSRPAAGFVAQTVDLADRGDIDLPPVGGGIVDRQLDGANALVFTSDPLRRPTELSGLFSGRLDFVSNKKDLDFRLELYERTARGEYVQLSYYLARASHVADRTRRRLLTPGRRQQLPFESGRLTSRLLAAGSRLVVVLRINKGPMAQINYGTGRDVSDETVADAGEPLSIRWLATSFVDLPVRYGGIRDW